MNKQKTPMTGPILSGDIQHARDISFLPMDSRSLLTANMPDAGLTNIIRRDRLLNPLNETSAPLITLAAPAGAGKTTLIAHWLELQAQPYIWLQLSSQDNNPATFFDRLSHAVQQSTPPQHWNLPPLPDSAAPLPDAFGNTLFSALIEQSNQPLTLVLDDYHTLTQDASLHTLLNDVIQTQASPFRCILISRNNDYGHFIRLKAHQQLLHFSGPDLRFTRDETRQFLAETTDIELPEVSLHKLDTQLGGWAAGLKLITKAAGNNLLAQLTVQPPAAQSSLHGWQTDIHAYFAKEVMAGLSNQEIKLLLITSFTPFTNAPIAVSLSKLTDAGQLLTSLHGRNLFIEHISDTNTAYQYHPLFHDYLQHEARHRFTQRQYRALGLRSARQLNAHGFPEHAIDLFLSLKAYRQARTAIKQHANKLITEGQVRRVSQWLAQIPTQLVIEDPLTLLLLGQCCLLTNSDGALDSLLATADTFLHQEMYAAAIQAYGKYLQAVTISGIDYRAVDTCMIKLDPLLPNNDPQIQAALAEIASTVLFALSFRDMKHPSLPTWRALAESSLHTQTDATLLLSNCNQLMMFYLHAGEMLHICRIMETLVSPLRSKTASNPALHLQTLVIEVYYRGHVIQDVQRAKTLAQQGIALGQKTGITLYEFWFRYMLVVIAICQNDLSLAEAEINDLQANIMMFGGSRRADIFHLRGFLALARQDWGRARADLQQAQNIFKSAHTPYSEHWTGLMLAVAHYGLGETDQCRSHIMHTTRMGWLGSTHLQYHCLTLSAWVELNTDNPETGLNLLEQVFTLARKQQMTFIPMIGQQPFIQLCQHALDAGIETPFIQRVILGNNLSLEGASRWNLSWPRELRIYTLTSFQIVDHRSEPPAIIELQTKPLMLLKAIIAFGGTDIPIRTLCDALWTDTEGDAALRAFKVNLHRLRKGLGSENCIEIKNNKVSLAATCWVDALIFWKSMPLGTTHCTQQLRTLVQLYQARFLEGDAPIPWIKHARERIHQNYLRLLEHLGQVLMQHDQIGDAIIYFEEALLADPLEEDYYCNLMQCYSQLQRPDRVAKTFHRYCTAYRDHLGIQPSPRAKALHERLLKATL
ncbi:BTAD domain-containing putative transcriptional regulator [Marinobacterium halophilum]|nr:BTAD domain-containing putative transcriptional regulator [Marinobacterium halophilum]